MFFSWKTVDIFASVAEKYGWLRFEIEAKARDIF